MSYLSVGTVLPSSSSSFLSLSPPFSTPLLWSELTSRCEVEWLASQLWSGCAWIKVVTKQRGGWQMPQPESFSIRLPFQNRGQGEMLHRQTKKEKKEDPRKTHSLTHTYTLQAKVCVHRPILVMLISHGVTPLWLKEMKNRKEWWERRAIAFSCSISICCLVCPALDLINTVNSLKWSIKYFPGI